MLEHCYGVACMEILIIEAEGASDMQGDLIWFIKVYSTESCRQM